MGNVALKSRYLVMSTHCEESSLVGSSQMTVHFCSDDYWAWVMEDMRWLFA